MSNATTNAEPGRAPDFLTLLEAAQVLRIGRTAIYQQARLFEATAGAEGDVQVERFGKQFRVARRWLEQKIGGPITWPLVPTAVPADAAEPATPPAAKPRARRRQTDASPRLFSA